MAIKRASKPLQPATVSGALKIPASKPRNPVATDPLLKKSGPHISRRRTQKEPTQQQFRMELSELRFGDKNAND